MIRPTIGRALAGPAADLPGDGPERGEATEGHGVAALARSLGSSEARGDGAGAGGLGGSLDLAGATAADAFDFRPDGPLGGVQALDAARPLDRDPGGWADGAGALSLAAAPVPVPVPAAPALDDLPGPFAGAAAVPDGADSLRLSGARLDLYTSGTGGLGVHSGFNIQLVFAGSMSADLRDDFILAAEYMSTLITAGLPDRGWVDDLVIVAQVSAIDGPDGVLGQAGPVRVRDDSGLPVAAVMQFDTADARALEADGLFDDTVVHEMMHCLGFGTVWEDLGLTSGSVASGDMRFTGANAVAAYPASKPGAHADDPHPGRGVPVETHGGAGTAGGHWDEDLFGKELMTGYLDPGGGVSPITVASLEDLGYATIYDPATPGRGMPQPDDLLG